MENLVNPDFSEWYGYDSYDRLRDFKRGTLNTGKTDVTGYTSNVNVTQRQQWSGMDVLGNWLATLTTQAGVTTTDARTHNLANEIEERSLTEGTNGAVSAEFANDHNGNLTNDGEFVYEYDVENRLTRASRITDDDPLTTEVVGEYYYDALGRRVRKVVSNSGQSADGDFTWLWNPQWKLIQNRRLTASSGETIAQEHIDAGPTAYIDDHVAYYDADAGTNGTPSILFIHADHMATTAALTGAAGSAIERYSPDSHGWAVVYDGSFTNAGTLSAYGNSFIHQGLSKDSESTSYYNRNRQFANNLGRYVQRDPMEYIDGACLYQYALGNPCAFTDELGLLVDATYDRRLGLLIVRDRDTGKEVHLRGFSGDAEHHPIPIGRYEILERKGKKDWYRLDPFDSHHEMTHLTKTKMTAHRRALSSASIREQLVMDALR